MNLPTPCSIVLLALASCAATPATHDGTAAAALAAQEEAAVRSTLAELDSSWQRHDLQAMEALLTDDVQWIVTNGNCWRGRQAVGAAYGALHRHLVANAPNSPMCHVTTTNIEVQFEPPQTALGMATLMFGDGSNGSDQDGPGWHTRASFVMVRRGGAWRIAQFHQTMLDPRVEREDPLWGDAARRRRGENGSGAGR